jgi:hypothetical protein
MGLNDNLYATPDITEIRRLGYMQYVARILNGTGKTRREQTTWKTGVARRHDGSKNN